MPGAAAVAKELSLTPRTLQRRLAERGTTFQDVVRDTRLQMAHELLPRPGMTLARLAPLLGLSEASAVSRLLRQAGGANPVRGKSVATQRKSQNGRTHRDHA